MTLIPTPVLDPRNEEQIAAQAIALTVGPLTVERCEAQIDQRLALITLLQAGSLPPAICPELTNANPSSPHTVIIEALAWLVGLQRYAINQLPEKVVIEFARLFGIELKAATAATVILQFTVDAPPGVDVTIPAGTEVSTLGGEETFVTDEELIILDAQTVGAVSATRNVAGETELAPNVLTELQSPLSWVDSVTNPDAIDTGTNAETVTEALARSRAYQLRGERLVTSSDLENAILNDVMQGNGLVKVFPFIQEGDWSQLRAGYSTVVVMTHDGGPVNQTVKDRISEFLDTMVGNQFVTVTDPEYVDFDVEADIRLTGLTTQDATLTGIEANLRAFYGSNIVSLGRSILRSEIIAMIEGSIGVDQIVAQPSGEILILPLVDTDVAPYQLPRLETVTLNVVA